MHKATKIAVCSIARAEFYGAIGIKLQAGELIPSEHSAILTAGENDFADFEIVPYDERVESIIKRLSAKYGHRTLDYIQLASALLAKPKYFVTADKRLAKLARSERLNVKLV